MSLNLYPIIRELGVGGFGKTYLATNTLMPSQQTCVLKQLLPVGNSPQLQQLIEERFKREAIILEGLGERSNGTIPKLYAYFVDRGEFYLVQEYIEGQTLAEKMTSCGFLQESEVRRLLIEILPTLAYVHQNKIVHRDIKPENIILRRDDGKPVLIDFGAVKETMSTVANNSWNSSRSIVIGTPGFMPMEQTAGRPMFASDIYAIGLTAISALTGKHPSELETDPDTGNIEWKAHAPHVSSSLAEVLDKSIQTIGRDRYASAQQMLQALEITNQTVSQGTTKTQISSVPANYVQQAYDPGAVKTTVVDTGNRQNDRQHDSNINNSLKAALLGVVISSVLILLGLFIGKGIQQPSGAESKVASGTSNVSAPKSTSNPNASRQEIHRGDDPSRSVMSNNSQNRSPALPVEASTPIAINRPPTDRFISNYYSKIKSGQTVSSWGDFSSDYQNNSRANPGGYSGDYLKWWGGLGRNTEVGRIETIDANADRATVHAHCRFRGKSYIVQYHLAFDDSSQSWKIIRVSKL